MILYLICGLMFGKLRLAQICLFVKYAAIHSCFFKVVTTTIFSLYIANICKCFTLLGF